MNRSDALVAQYQILSAHAVHWLSHVWHVNQFFVAVESLFLAGTAIKLAETLATSIRPAPQLYVLFIVLIAFNVILCYIWFRTHRRNFEYLEARFTLLKEFEANPDLAPFLEPIFQRAEERLRPTDTYRARSSRRFELFIPKLFILGWFALALVLLIPRSV